MAETTKQYTDRLASYLVGKNALEMQEQAPGTLARLIEGAADRETLLRRRPLPTKWSALEIVAHLAEDELVASWRYRQMIEHSGEKLDAFDQDEWARLGDYASWNIGDALQMFRLLREANLRLLRRLTADEWQRTGEHAERGRMTVRDLANHMAAHDINHIKQIEKLLT